MPHVAFVPLTGFRVREAEMLALGMALPSLRQRADAVGRLPALGLLTLAGLTPEDCTCSYHEADTTDEALVQQLIQEHPDLVAISALTASIEEAYRFSAVLRRAGIRVVLGGLHATACPEEARTHCDAVVAGESEPVWLEVLADAEPLVRLPAGRQFLEQLARENPESLGVRLQWVLEENEKRHEPKR